MLNPSVIPLPTHENGPEERKPDLQPQAGPLKKITNPPSRQKLHSARKRKAFRSDLIAPSTEDLKNQPPEVLARYYAQIESDFFSVIKDYLDEANAAARQFKKYSGSQRRWQFWIIVATGMLAAINVCAAFEFLKPWGPTGIPLPTLLTAVAAVYAGGLTLVQNLNCFLHNPQQAVVFHETRDLLLTRYREYSSKWVYFVEAFGETPTAWRNAGRLYRELIASDQQLRQNLKQLTEVKGTGKSTSKPT